MVNLENYRLVQICDYDNFQYYFSILLNKKHSIEEFQNKIDELKNKLIDSIEEYGDDWTQISEYLTDFDYIELNEDNKIYF